jgi:hypothetical protein
MRKDASDLHRESSPCILYSENECRKYIIIFGDDPKQR